ncbi:MAG: hypothetical protein N2645_05980 [Clostridia bacterium]|nr:hypothetical protein [Clostridia bacterium]
MELYHVGRENEKKLSRYPIELNEIQFLTKNELLSVSMSIGLKLNVMSAEKVNKSC